MLNNNGMRPAFAASGAQGFSNADRSKMNSHISFSEAQAEADDFNAFGSTPQTPKAQPKRTQPKKAKQPKQPKPPAKIPLSTILKACGILAAVILVIVLLVAIFAAPKKEIRYEKNVYFSYVETSDSGESVTRIVSNGKLLKETFKGDVKLTPADDYSFAYIVQHITTEEEGGKKPGYYTYILKGKKIKDLEFCSEAEPQLARLEPGVVYQKGSGTFYYNSKASGLITGLKGMDIKAFKISDDAKVIVFPTQDDTGKYSLMYFRDGNSNAIYSTTDEDGVITPISLSIDGKYVYAHNYAQGVASLVYFEVKKNNEGEVKPQTIFSSTASDTFTEESIVGINANGKEIVFHAQKDGKTVSYLCKISKKNELTELGEGVYTPVYADYRVVRPKTFVGSYFECKVDFDVSVDESDDEEETPNTTTVTTIATYLLDKKGKRLVANAPEAGKFSPDEKYFYYIDDTKVLKRVSLKSKDFKKSEKTAFNAADDFIITEKGDLYVMYNNSLEGNNIGQVYFINSSNLKPTLIADNVDLESVQHCANSIYFSLADDDKKTVYISTNGSDDKSLSFKDGTPAQAPKIVIGVSGVEHNAMNKRAYAIFVDTNDSVKLYYTSNGKKFKYVAGNCTIDGFNSSNSSTNNSNNSAEQ